MVHPIGPIGPIFDPRPVDPFRTLDRSTPIALLPVRLETRWFAGRVADELELRVRIFPDAIHIANTRSAQPVDAVVAPNTITAPNARGLPDRFAVCAMAGRTRLATTWSALLPSAVPLVPADDAPDWLADFAAAERLGLAARLLLARGDEARLTHVFVLGVRGTGNAAGSDVLATLLADHAADRGLSFLQPGTPTNHTIASRATSAALVANEPLTAVSDGARVASALGVDPSVFQPAGGAGGNSDALPRAMNRVAWPATWGYFLEHIVGEPVRDETRAAGRALYVEHVRADGPYPTLCIGRQPYGLLPISPLGRWRDPAGGVDRFAAALTALRPRWMTSGAGAPRLPRTGDALPALRAVLAQQPHSVRISARSAATVEIAGPWWFESLWGAIDAARREIILQRLRQPILEELARLGLNPRPDDIEPLVHGDAAHAVSISLIGAGPDPDRAPPYLEALAAVGDPAPLRDHQIAGAAPRSLLYLLLRHSTLLVLARAADDLLGTSVNERRERAVRTSDVATVWERFERPAAARSARSLLAAIDAGPLFSELRSHRSALRELAQAPAAALRTLTATTLDTASHRLDAWITALATRRLREMRSSGGAGIHLGACGWVSAPPVPATPAREGTAATANSHGYVLAPSLDHARTGAVLRAAFDARPTSDLAIDLSSARVRRARWLLDGLRAGRSLGELLGFRIERAVRDADAIRTLRRDFPLEGPGDGDPGRARLDGLAVYHAWRDVLPPEPLTAAAHELRDLVDATSDLLLAESVHQHVRGNPDRAGALLESVAAGTVAPPEPMVVQTPIDSDSTTFHVVWTFSAGDRGWPGDELRVRALANPVVNAALATMLGDPRRLGATVRFEHAGTRQTVERSVLELDLCALDLCALAGAERFDDTPLRALYAASAPTGATAVTVEPGVDLHVALAVARSFAAALQVAVPWTTAGEPPLDDAAWQADSAAAIAVLRGLDAGGSDADRARLAAILAAPLVDSAGAMAMAAGLAERSERAANSSERVRLLSGLPATAALPTAVVPEPVRLATASARIEWLADAARLRQPLAALERVTTALARDIHVVRSGDGMITIALGASPAASTRGLRLDAWSEAQPRPELTAGVAFHHDAPRARAPQTVLLAVPPDPTQPWSLDALTDTLAEAIELATIRLARPHEVWGPLLPALYLADSLDGGTISTPIRDLATDVLVREA